MTRPHDEKDKMPCPTIFHSMNFSLYIAQPFLRMSCHSGSDTPLMKAAPPMAGGLGLQQIV